jgi:cell division protease FtsH
MFPRRNNRNIIILLVAVFVIALLLSLGTTTSKSPPKVSISTVLNQIHQNKIQEITEDQGNLSVQLKNGEKENSTIGANESLVKDYGIDPTKVTINHKLPSDNSLWINLAINFLPIIIIVGFFYFLMRQAQGSNNQALSFGKSRARLFAADKEQVSFADVAGAQEAKQELEEVVEFLKYPAKFTSLGAKIPKGVLLVGPPGTGKTLLARAVAGEAGVPFFSISGSEFVEMFVGVGASRVRDLFAKAKKNAPCIIFIDEIDAVGRQRGAGLGGSHDEREQTLNQILTEMDGFEQGTNVIVVAATNRPDVLDPALLRPGRFDRRVVIDAPDVHNREAILEVHVKGKPLDKSIDLERIAKQTPGFSGADLANLVNEATIMTGRRNKKKVTQDEMSEAIEKVMLGPERKSHLLSPKEKEITAYHEAGHALVSHLLPDADPVHKVSVVSRGMAAGYTWQLPTEDKHLHSRKSFEDDLAVMMAGREAELEVYHEATTGASNDMQRATQLARRMVTQYGMSDKLGPITYGQKDELIFLGREISEQRNYSEKTAQEIDGEVAVLIEAAQKVSRDLIVKNRRELDKIATTLIKEETIEGEDFVKLFDSPEPAPKSVTNRKVQPAPDAA